MNILFSLILFKTALSAPPQALPEHNLFTQPLADPLSPESSLTVRTLTDSQTGILGRLGVNRPLVQFTNGRFTTQIGFSALAHMGFQSDGELTFGLRTFDGIFAVPISLAVGETVLTLRWLHRSSHYADGIRFEDEMPSNTDSTSSESLEFSVSETRGWVTGHNRFEWRYHSVHETSRYLAAFGIDISPPGATVPYASSFIFGDLDGGALSAELGFLVRGPNSIRFGISGYTGRAIAGKLNGEDEKYLGLTVAFGSGI
jgi:hypothetical protein